MNRRNFIKGIMAAAVAAQIPMGFEEAEQLAKSLPPNLFVNGELPTGMTDVGNGWYRMWWATRSPDVINLNNTSDGDFIFNLETGRIEEGEDMTFSIYAKNAKAGPAPDGSRTDLNVWGAQLESGPATTAYIPTASK